MTEYQKKLRLQKKAELNSRVQALIGTNLTASAPEGVNLLSFELIAAQEARLNTAN